MKNINIKVDRQTSMVYLNTNIIGNDGENLQGDIIFSFENGFVNGQARLEYEIDNVMYYTSLDKQDNTYKTPIKSVLTKAGSTNMQLVVTEGVNEDEIPVFKSNVFYLFCNDSLNAEIEEPEEYPSWIEVANTKLNSIDEAIAKANNLDINVIKQENGAIVTIINQDGTEESVEIHDGIDGKDGVDGAPGRDGVDGKDGKDGANGKDGYTPQKGVDYFDGKDGENGKDGYTPVKGVDYFDGVPGRDGADGKNGVEGAPGKDGENGKDGITPIMKVGTTTTGDAGTNANVTMTKSDNTYTLNFTIPKGEPGENGSGGEVDLSNYYTKDQVDAKFDALVDGNEVSY